MIQQDHKSIFFLIKNFSVENSNVFLPAQMKINAGSNATLVSNDKLLKVSFSVQAQTPMAKMLKPINQKITLNPKITYLRQQETSL